ncbi:Sec-independent protein translocase protein TatB [Neopusillimonas maritima]|uniref:Sec-independent protein translocase protein TatB n=1 Tax=Neopusillimonas maritima TaxID=2026239 RepID=A0ABX9MXS2_9BURK|nr:Sec-independent protein translocase protein TatB [Neopusillimonas maritima]RII83346.1 twin-arginine translocase subunit TatB [Neopusillimonas maritima]|tara:strand:+ start:117704 stop:118135 length:432 start_codon:yes stop_codon:yes gene_type:complete
MFGLSFTELMIIGVVALLVIGPERLPNVARTVGHLLGRAQRYVNDVKTDIKREMDSAEIGSLKGQIEDAAKSVRSSVDDAGNTIRNPLEEAKKALQDTEQTLKETEQSIDSSIRSKQSEPSSDKATSAPPDDTAGTKKNGTET